MNKEYTGEVTVKIHIENGKINVVNLDNKVQSVSYDAKDYKDVNAWYVDDVSEFIGEFLENACT